MPSHLTCQCRVDAPQSVYHGCRGQVIGQSTTGVQLELVDPPDGWPARVWFDYAEVEDVAT